MKRAVEHLLRGELIGLPVKVGHIEGTIVDETKNTFTLITSNGTKKRCIKAANKFEFKVNGKRVIIDGSLLSVRPEQRIAIKLR